jgi:membrane-bound lytic murein transglycosylase MltF
MKKILLIVLTCLVPLLIVSCALAPEENSTNLDVSPTAIPSQANVSEDKVSKPSANALPIENISEISLDEKELAYLKKLNEKGSIKVATLVTKDLYLPQPDGTIDGFHYNLLKKFADLINIDIEVEIRPIGDFFYKEGYELERVMTEPDYAYVPTLLEEVDLYLAGITDVPWREKMFDIVRFIPSRQLVVTRNDLNITTYEDLNNKICLITDHTSLKDNLDEIKNTQNLNFEYKFIKDIDDIDKFISEGEGDFTVYDSDRAIISRKRYENLKIAMPLSEVEYMGWALKNEDTELKTVLDKYIEYSIVNGIMDEHWNKVYGESYIEYLNLFKE